MRPSSRSAQVRPGQTAGFSIWVWAQGRPVSGVVVRLRIARVTAVSAPRFTDCPSGAGSSCSLSSVPVSRSDELAAAVSVGSQAWNGELIELTATATAAGARTGSATAIAAVATQPSAPTSPLVNTALELGAVGGDFPPLVSVPGVVPMNPATLFPAVSPSAGSQPMAAGRHKRAEAVTVAAMAQSRVSLFGGQVAGLAILAGAVAIAFVRLSLRSRRAAGAAGAAGSVPSAKPDR